MGPIGCPESSVRNCHYALRNNQEAHSSPSGFSGIVSKYNTWIITKYSLYYFKITRDLENSDYS